MPAGRLLLQLMLMLKFATKDMEAALGGCFENYTAQGPVTKAETNAKRVIIARTPPTTSSSDPPSTSAPTRERNNSGNHSMAEARTVLFKTTIDATNVALNIDGAAITTTTTAFVSTMPWKTGATDSIRGRGRRTPPGRHAGWQPVRLQGIERGNGIYEVDADAIVNAYKDADGIGHTALYLVHDITKASKTSTDNYTRRRVSDPRQDQRLELALRRGLQRRRRARVPADRHRRHLQHRPHRRRLCQSGPGTGAPTGAPVRPSR